MSRCWDCTHFSPDCGRIKHPGDFCCISMTANSLRRDYPDIFKSETRFPPPNTEFHEWAEKNLGCSFFQLRPNPLEAYNA